MKAVELSYYGSGESNLKIVQKPAPDPGAGEVLVRMIYAPLNPSDIYNTLQGTYRKALSNAIWNYGKKKGITFFPNSTRTIVDPPFTPGLEGMGIVEKAGSGLLAKRLVGKRVAVIGSGTWAEYTCVPAKQVIVLPKSLSDEEGACSMINPLTVTAMLFFVLNIKKGKWLLQSAANSELGKMVIRIGKKLGFHTINIVRNSEHVDTLKNIGANHVLVWGKDNIREAVHTITLGNGVHYAIDAVAGKIGSEMTFCLAPQAKMIVYGTLSSEPLKFSSRNLMTPLASIEGFFLTNFFKTLSTFEKIQLLQKTKKLLKDGVFKADIDAIYPMEQVRSAVRHAKRPGHKGKVLIQLNP